MKEIEKFNKDDLLLWDARLIRSYYKKLVKKRCLIVIRKHSFWSRYPDTENGLEKEIIEAKRIHKYKLDNI